MIIEKIEIKRFRGFENVEFNLGSQLTIIAGKNGTQKTTILGLLSQPFSVSLPDNPMKSEKPLCGGSFKSDFKEKFKLSNTFDKAKEHEWTLHLKNENIAFTIESIKRSGGGIRFYKKGDHSKGAGYIQLPVIYLSLKRLIPIGEDLKLNESSSIALTLDEQTFFNDWYKKILISMDDIISSNYLESRNKNTIGINTQEYDWHQNSTGQDNIGKILLAIISFKRLKEKYKDVYKGGILAIDELDAALYPGSQIKLIQALTTFSARYKIQIIFTTHSISSLEYCCEEELKNTSISAKQNHLKVIYLEKKNNKVKIDTNISITSIRNRLMASYRNESIIKLKIPVYTEDKETIIFAKALLKSKCSKLSFINCSLSCSKLIDLAFLKIPSFSFPNSIVILDGDIRGDAKELGKVKNLNNFLLLPTQISPERIIANFLLDLDDESPIWTSINIDFNKESCFKDYNINEIRSDRDKAKKWFNSHLGIWGNNAIKIINPWISINEEAVNQFISDFTNVYNQFAKELALDLIL
ncbi:AAA family ATPase [Parasediminibacterium sp. JCM 36343]|uniref:AAA family ATPase n=1 Tax=Parasediminibacterium sp. JCM 36343 TaxID=3374279 RepID=UPI00397E813E